MANGISFNLSKILAASQVALLFLIFALPATPAHSQNGGLLEAVCTGPLKLEFNPGLGLIPKPVVATGEGAISCVFTQDFSTHEALVVDLIGTGDSISCLFNGGVEGSMRFEWDDMSTSTVHWSSLKLEGLGLPAVQRVFVMSGTVVEGKFAGSQAVLTYNDVPSLTYLNCFHGNLTEIDGSPIGTITRPLP